MPCRLLGPKVEARPPAPQPWLLGAPDILLTHARTPTRPPTPPNACSTTERGRRVLMLARAPGGLLVRLPDLVPVALVVLDEKLRRSNETMPYFGRQKLLVKVIW
jgi:hypothetical protein